MIISIRGHRVILDADLARLYSVTTRVLNQGVRRNSHRFPDDFAFQLTATEAANLKSQLAASRTEILDPKTDASNRSQIVTGSQKHRDPRFRPWAFTEHGALMAANVLRSRRAVQMSVYVIRAFVRLREHSAANHAILKRLAEIDKMLLRHDTALRASTENCCRSYSRRPTHQSGASVSARTKHDRSRARFTITAVTPLSPVASRLMPVFVAYCLSPSSRFSSYCLSHVI